MKEQLISTITTMITTNFVRFMEYDQQQLDSLNNMTSDELRMFHTELTKIIPTHE